MQLSFWQVIVLAIVQGVAEFLPVSSSGHVVILASILSPTDQARYDTVDLNVALQLGTLFSIVLVYFHQIRRMLTDDRRMIGLLIIATVPAVAVGLTLENWFEQALSSPLVAGACLIATGVMLLVTSRLHHVGRSTDQISCWQALLIGIAQAFAILPGISRSGWTISAAMALGVSTEKSATFSFLMALPVIAGAGGKKIITTLMKASTATDPAISTPWLFLAVGALVSFVVGVAALSWLIRWLKLGRFYWFAWWCIPVGAAVVVWQLAG